MRKCFCGLLLSLVTGLAHGSGTSGFENEYVPRVNFSALLEPATGIIHGAGQDPASYQEYSALFDPAHRPMMQMTYISLTGGADSVREWQARVQASLDSLAGQPTTLQIGLTMVTGQDDGSGDAGAAAKGAYDSAIEAFITALKAFDVPAWVRIGYEFEGSWNGYTSEGYVSAFKYITTKMREAGLDEVATVWCAAGGSAGFIDFGELMAYYPGDEFVDWWGVDTFSPDELTNPWLEEFFNLAADHRKPVMIGEATPRYVGTIKGRESWDAWFKPFFEMVRKNPGIKAISYINWDWVYWSDALGFSWHDWEDARLQNDELVSGLYVEELSNPIWIHAPDAESIIQSKPTTH